MTAAVLFWIELLLLSLVSFFALGVKALRGFSRHQLQEICDAMREVWGAYRETAVL